MMTKKVENFEILLDDVTNYAKFAKKGVSLKSAFPLFENEKHAFHLHHTFLQYK